MKKKKKKNKNDTAWFDTELLREYMTGATNPGFSSKTKYSNDVVDLHLENISTGKGPVPPADALFYQLQELEKAIDQAIAAGKLELRVVHGLGKGKLKAEVIKILQQHPQVKSFSDAPTARYGYGSTIIYFY